MPSTSHRTTVLFVNYNLRVERILDEQKRYTGTPERMKAAGTPSSKTFQKNFASRVKTIDEKRVTTFNR